MSYLSKILYYVKKFFYSSDDYIMYLLESRPAKVNHDREIRIYKNYQDIPVFIVKELSIYPLFNPLCYRIKTGQAELICIHRDSKIIAYGWLQKWDSFRHKFGWLIKKGTMLGPFWTNPEFRGSGYYGRLLDYCISLPEHIYPLVIYTNPRNISSQRGIDKAGFKKIGVYHIVFFIRFFQRHSIIK